MHWSFILLTTALFCHIPFLSPVRNGTWNTFRQSDTNHSFFIPFAGFPYTLKRPRRVQTQTIVDTEHVPLRKFWRESHELHRKWNRQVDTWRSWRILILRAKEKRMLLLHPKPQRTQRGRWPSRQLHWRNYWSICRPLWKQIRPSSHRRSTQRCSASNHYRKSLTDRHGKNSSRISCIQVRSDYIHSFKYVMRCFERKPDRQFYFAFCRNSLHSNFITDFVLVLKIIHNILKIIK